MSKFTDKIERNLKGVEFFSVGASDKCEECGDGGDEDEFSWSDCDSCGSRLGGTRHAAHGVVGRTLEFKGDVLHFKVCIDCLMFHANGDEPEEGEEA